MKVSKCENGHFYDLDSYDSCPICGTGPAGDKGGTEKKGIFFRSKKNSAKAAEEQTVALPRESWDRSQEAEERVVVQVTENPAPPEASPQPGLKEAIQQGSSLSEGKTLSYFSTLKQAGAAVAGAALSAISEVNEVSASAGTEKPSTPLDPVVGWLVCIQGAHLCEVFKISVGLNSIGRSESNQIVLSKDPAVSREKHAFLTFEPKARQFYLRPGDSSGLVYLNDEYIYETKLLHGGDTISLGQSRFYFQPLCGEGFSWEDYI